MDRLGCEAAEFGDGDPCRSRWQLGEEPPGATSADRALATAPQRQHRPDECVVGAVLVADIQAQTGADRTAWGHLAVAPGVPRGSVHLHPGSSAPHLAFGTRTEGARGSRWSASFGRSNGPSPAFAGEPSPCTRRRCSTRTVPRPSDDALEPSTPRPTGARFEPPRSRRAQRRCRFSTRSAGAGTCRRACAPGRRLLTEPRSGAIDHAIHALDPGADPTLADHKPERFRTLNAEQARAVQRSLVFASENDDSWDGQVARHALEAY